MKRVRVFLVGIVTASSILFGYVGAAVSDRVISQPTNTAEQKLPWHAADLSQPVTLVATAHLADSGFDETVLLATPLPDEGHGQYAAWHVRAGWPLHDCRPFGCPALEDLFR